jgi:glucose dehydrogenase
VVGRVTVFAALMLFALAVPWPLLPHMLQAPTGQRALNAAIFVLILFAVLRLPGILVRRQRAQSAKHDRGAFHARPSRRSGSAKR